MAKNRQGRPVSFFGTGMTTTISITLVLLLLGLTILVGFMGKGIASYIKENLAVTVEISDKAKPEDIQKLQKQLEESPFAKKIKYISKEEIKEQLISDLGRDPEEVLGYNPASSCFEVYLKAEYANSDSIRIIEQNLKSKNISQNILYNEDDLDIVNANLSKIGTGMLILAVILMFISFTLIRNTIRLSIYSKRFTISTMQLVGATNSFIRRPFIRQTIGRGLIAALLANVLITAIVYSLIREYADLLSVIRPQDLIFLYIVVLLLGLLLTFLATYFAVNKYLKMNTNNLYYI